ncbi:hypothetical protein [Cytobacillus firmus]|uniref:hypothetical protein n=1 Tax=Cytobacillus firmus TaxID=1399 RepID=UPI00222811E8|nr:hypothetical protein [Cytobacillus firmus]
MAIKWLSCQLAAPERIISSSRIGINYSGRSWKEKRAKSWNHLHFSSQSLISFLAIPFFMINVNEKILFQACHDSKTRSNPLLEGR